MRIRRNIIVFFVFLSISFSCLIGQESFYDPHTKNLLDSLDKRIAALQIEIPRLAETRATNYFFAKRDLDFTIFLKHYKQYVFDEELDKAQDLVESRLQSVQKRGDKVAQNFYKEYKSKINNEISNQQRRYQVLFEKEKTFNKEFYRFVNRGDEYSLKRAQRMTDLTLKYALEKNLTSVYGYLHHYKNYIQSILFDFYSDYDLAKLTNNEAAFQKIFKPLVESDSLEMIEKAGKLVEHCHNYVSYIPSDLDSLYFARQNNVVASFVSDYHARKGSLGMFSKTGESFIIAKLDTLVQEGIFKW